MTRSTRVDESRQDLLVFYPSKKHPSPVPFNNFFLCFLTFQLCVAIGALFPFYCYRAPYEPHTWRAPRGLASDWTASCILVAGSTESLSSTDADKQCFHCWQPSSNLDSQLQYTCFLHTCNTPLTNCCRHQST